MKMAVFWDVASYSLVDIDRRLRGTYCLHHQDDDQRLLHIMSMIVNNMSAVSYDILNAVDDGNCGKMSCDKAKQFFYLC
jgi:hypothetical protein